MPVCLMNGKDTKVDLHCLQMPYEEGIRGGRVVHTIVSRVTSGGLPKVVEGEEIEIEEASAPRVSRGWIIFPRFGGVG